jgi:hypothetical protein
MADIYIDPSVVGPGAGTLSDPFASWASVSWAAGNSYLQKRNTTFSGRVTVGASGTSLNRIYIGAYGTGAKPKIVGGSSDTAGIRVSNRSYVTFEALDISCPTTSSSGNGLEGFFATASEGISIRVIDCDIHDCKNIGLVLFTNVVGVGAKVRDGYAQSCTFIGNGYHGSAVYGAVDGFEFIDCQWDRNGLTVDGHGGSSFAHRNTYNNTGWTNTTGTIYTRTVSAPAGTSGTPSDVYQVVYNKTPYWNLNKNTATPTEPGLGEFGFVAGSPGSIYVNVGEAPAAGREIKAAVEQAVNIRYTGGVAQRTNRVTQEGSGVQADDFSLIIVAGLESKNNEGSGIFLNLGRGSIIQSAVLTANQDSGLHAAAAPFMDVEHVTAFANTVAEVKINFGSDGASVTNSIMANGAVGIVVDADSSNCTLRSNCVHGNGTNYSGISAGVGDVSVPPQLRSNYMPQNEAVLAAGLALGGTDFYGVPFGNPPTIGAVQFGGSNTLQYHLGETGMAIERPRPRGPREYAQSR